jgi:glycosyltransferase involved in cell wall biosynthesis
MKYSNLITVIIPTYNSELYLKDSLDSLVNQQTQAKILVADGNSSDGTLRIIDNYKKKIDISVVSNSDSGQSDAINKMVSHVQTLYFLWFNSDDILLPSAIKVFDDFLNKNDYNFPMISGDHYNFNEDGLINNIYGCHQYKSHILKGVWRGDFPSVIWNKDVFIKAGMCNPALHFSMDQDLVYNIALNGKKKLISFHIPKILGGFRFHKESKTTGDLYLKKIKQENDLFLKRYSLSKLDFLAGKTIYYLLSLRIVFFKIFK